MVERREVRLGEVVDGEREREREDDTREKTSERERRTRGGGGDGESMSVDVSGNMGIEEEDSEREVESRMDGKIKLGGNGTGVENVGIYARHLGILCTHLFTWLGI